MGRSRDCSAAHSETSSGQHADAAWDARAVVGIRRAGAYVEQERRIVAGEAGRELIGGDARDLGVGLTEQARRSAFAFLGQRDLGDGLGIVVCQGAADTPWAITETTTTTPANASNASESGTPSVMSSRPKSSELRPRGPNQPINWRPWPLIGARHSTRLMATGRATSSTTTANSSAGRSGTVPITDDSRAPNRMKASSITSSDTMAPKSRKQSQTS